MALLCYHLPALPKRGQACLTNGRGIFPAAYSCCIWPLHYLYLLGRTLIAPFNTSCAGSSISIAATYFRAIQQVCTRATPPPPGFSLLLFSWRGRMRAGFCSFLLGRHSFAASSVCGWHFPSLLASSLRCHWHAEQVPLADSGNLLQRCSRACAFWIPRTWETAGDWAGRPEDLPRRAWAHWWWEEACAPVLPPSHLLQAVPAYTPFSVCLPFFCSASALFPFCPAVYAVPRRCCAD